MRYWNPEAKPHYAGCSSIQKVRDEQGHPRVTFSRKPRHTLPEQTPTLATNNPMDAKAEIRKTSFRIRNARQMDAALLPRIEQSAAQAFHEISSLAWITEDEPMPEETHRTCIVAGKCWVAVAETDQPMAFLSACVEDRYGHILEMSVASSVQGRGIGTDLIETL